MNTLAELPSAVAVITVAGLVAIAVAGCVACRIVAIVTKASDRTGLAACLKEVAGIIQAVRQRR